MGKKGNKPLKATESITTPATLHCMGCNKPYDSDDFYGSDSILYKSIGKIPYCKECIDNFYQTYLKEYKVLKYDNVERKAIERICMAFDVYYSDKVFDNAVKDSEKTGATYIASYFKQVKLYQYRKKNYNTTIDDKINAFKNGESLIVADVEQNEDIIAATKFFGTGFTDDDYIFLYEQYTDWTTRHECETKSQEEIFKQLCFTQLELLKKTRAKEDTKDLNATFLKQLEAAKLQPKQNKGETVSEAQTFGTLIDKWENTRPLPEIDESLKDVDRIGLYIDVFFRGHLAKMMGLKNGLSNLYTNFIKKYTVSKPEYDDDESSEALFDAIFGNQDTD